MFQPGKYASKIAKYGGAPKPDPKTFSKPAKPSMLSGRQVLGTAMKASKRAMQRP